MFLLSFVNHLANLLQRSSASQKTSAHVSTILCNHLAKLLQKIISIRSLATHLRLGPGVCHSSPILTNLPFHEFLKHFNHDLWFNFLGISEKAGLSEVSCRRLSIPENQRITPVGNIYSSFILHSWLTISWNCLKWRFVPKRGRVADSWRITCVFIFCEKLLQKIVTM
jgi:hypothetical protein